MSFLTQNHQNNDERIGQTFILIVGAIILIYFGYKRENKDDYIRKNGTITQGRILDVYVQRGFHTKFEFVFNNDKYANEKRGYFKKLDKNARCYVKFLPDNPSESILITDRLVPYCVDSTMGVIYEQFPVCD